MPFASILINHWCFCKAIAVSTSLTYVKILISSAFHGSTTEMWLEATSVICAFSKFLANWIWSSNVCIDKIVPVINDLFFLFLSKVLSGVILIKLGSFIWGHLIVVIAISLVFKLISNISCTNTVLTAIGSLAFRDRSFFPSQVLSEIDYLSRNIHEFKASFLLVVDVIFICHSLRHNRRKLLIKEDFHVQLIKFILYHIQSFLFY